MIHKGTEVLVDKICRSCMGQNETMLNVFEERETFGDERVMLSDMLMACASVEVASNDGLPVLLCIICKEKLNSAYDFKKQCERSDTALRQLVSSSESVKKEDPDATNQDDLDISFPDDDNFADSESDDEQVVKKEKTPDSFTCSYCQKVLTTKKGLKIHQRKHTGQKLRTCEICDATFTRTNHLNRHMLTHESKDGSNHICDICGKSFSRAYHLSKHKKEHKQEDTIETKDEDVDKENLNIEHQVENEEVTKLEVNVELNDVNGLFESDDQGNYDDNNDDDYPDYTDEKKPKREREDRKKGSYECDVCYKVMTTYVGLKIHMRRHTGTDLAKCEYCEKTFTKTSHLKRHMNKHDIKEEKIRPQEKTEKENKVLECEYCDRKFKYRKSFNHHVKTEHGMSEDSDAPLSTLAHSKRDSDKNEGPPAEGESAENQQTVDYESSKLEESKEETDEGDDVPDVDVKPSTNPPRQKNHICHVCSASFLRANHLTRHMTLHRAILIHKCDRCDKAYATSEHLEKHVEEEHINKPYVCTICNKPFSRGEHLIRHLKVHQSDNEKDTLTCSICSESFTKSDQLARHTKVHLLQDKRHVCNECGKAFNRLDNLKTHQRTHTGVKDTSKLHLCIYCGKEFNNSSNMIVHMRRHTGERPYKCAECGKGFPRSHDLKCHERTHSGEKPYTCAVCGKSFNKSNKLLRHTRVHTGERPYVCNICGRAFTQSNDLALHMRRHTGARPYACGMCPARFIQSGQLKAHRRSTGHWMETQPDLKGGHRVEPVTPACEPTPIRFKSHGKMKKETTENVPAEVKEPKLLQHPVGILNNINMQAGIPPLLIDPTKLMGFQQNELPGLTSVINVTATNDGEVKFTSGLASFSNLNMKCETMHEDPDQGAGASVPTFHTGDPVANYASGVETSGSYTNATYTFQSFG